MLLAGCAQVPTTSSDTAPSFTNQQSRCLTDAEITQWAQAYAARQPLSNPPEGMTAEDAACTRAKLQATSAMGVLASGNLFSGLFQKDVLTRGVVSFGQPYAWKARPKALKLQYYAEHIGIADIDKNFGAPIHEGDRDKARIMVAIVDWNTRREVGSGTEAPTGTWDPEETTSVDEGPIIAYGSLFIDQSSTGGKMIDVQLPLNFYDTKAKPSGLYQIVISCSTSAYGDFMAGCKSNILYVDNFEWVY